MAKVLIKSRSSEIEAEHKKCYFELVRGLMFKKKGNALLEFKSERRHRICMLFMRYDLHLYFLNKRLEVVDVQYAKKISFDPSTWKLYCSEVPYKYVLEVDARENFKAEKGERLKVSFI